MERTSGCFGKLRHDLVRRPETATVLEWAERHLYLSPEYTLSEPGRFKVARTPWLKRPMEDFTDPKVHRMVLLWSNQSGKTIFAQAVVGRTIHLSPEPIIWLLPDEDLAKRISKERLAPMCRDCIPLRSRIKEPRSRDSGNTILSKSYPGGKLELPGANSPAGLSMSTAGILIFDETDLFPKASSNIGDPVSLLEKRATTAFNKKVILLSTPTDEAGRIWSEWEASDQATWMTPCPKCEARQSLEWDSENHNPDYETFTYRCCECHERSSEDDWKRSSTERGDYVAAFPQRSAKGYRVNGLVHPWLSWAELFREFFKAAKKMKAGDFWDMKTFRNGRLSLIWESKGDAETTDPQYLWNNHRVHYTAIPDDVVALTIGGDTQKDSVCLELCGWTALAGCRGIAYQVFGPGDPSQREFWKPIFAFANSEFKRIDGKTLRVSFGCVDAGGLYSDAVKKILGCGSLIKPIFGRREAVSKEVITADAGHTYWLVNSAMAKDEISFRQETGTDNHAMRWIWPMGPNGESIGGYDAQYFEEYCSEQRVVKYRNGEKFSIWESQRTGTRQEAWDSRVYSYSALIWLRKSRQDFLERAAAAIEAQIVNPPLRMNPPVNRDRRRSSMAVGGFGDYDVDSPFGVQKPQQVHRRPAAFGLATAVS